MKTHFLEATNNDLNWGKFLVCVYDNAELNYKSQMCEGEKPLLHAIGKWSRSFWLLDLQTGEGAEFFPPPPEKAFTAKFDLEKHRVWCCPLYEPTLTWLYANADLIFSGNLPAKINLPDAEFAWRGYRRPGPEEARVEEEIESMIEEASS